MKKIVLGIFMLALALNAKNIPLKTADGMNTNINAYYSIKGDVATITVEATNVGNTDKGGVSLSFPKFKDGKRIIEKKVTGFKDVKLYKAGKKIWNNLDRKTMRSEYLLAEGWANKWPSYKTMSVTLKVNMKGLNSFPLNIRAGDNPGWEEGAMESEQSLDQQGFPVYKHTIKKSNSKSSEIKSVDVSLSKTTTLSAATQKRIYQNLIYPQLKNHKFENSFLVSQDMKPSFVHTLTNVVNISLTEQLFIVSTINESMDCTQCKGVLSWFIIEGTKIVNKMFEDDEFSLGDNGQVTVPKVIKLGKNKIGFYMDTSFFRRGEEGNVVRIYEYKNNKMNEIFFIVQSSGQMGENEIIYDYNYKINFVESKKEYYDLKIEKDDGIENYSYKNGKYRLIKN